MASLHRWRRRERKHAGEDPDLRTTDVVRVAADLQADAAAANGSSDAAATEGGRSLLARQSSEWRVLT